MYKDTQELLEKHPKTTQVIKQWMVNQMVNSMKDTSVPEEFKEFMRKETIEDKNLIPIIDSNPRLLFDVFDENELYISIIKEANTTKFHYNINEASFGYAIRKLAERAAIEEAFEILEEKL